MLSKHASETTVSHLLNFLLLLVQEPLIVFVYKKVTSKSKRKKISFQKRDYFNPQDALFSAGAAKFSFGDDTLTDPPGDLEAGDERLLHQVFNSDIYLRVFRLIDNDQESIFSDINVAYKHEGGTPLSSDEDQERYVKRCVAGLFCYSALQRFWLSANEQPKHHTDDPFLRDYEKWVVSIFDLAGSEEQIELTGTDDQKEAFAKAKINRGSESLLMTVTADEAHKFWPEFRTSLTKYKSGLDRLYRKYSPVARRLKPLAGFSNRIDQDPANFPKAPLECAAGS